MLEWEPPDDNGGVELIGNVRTLGMFVAYTQCTVKLRSNFQKMAQLKCTNEKHSLTVH